MALTQAFVTIQDLRFTERQLGLGVTVTYKNTGTAGAETVTVTDQRAITVAIESGVSTATQIKAAVEASIPANALVAVTITGTGSNAQLSCVQATLAGGAAAVKASKQFNGLYVEALTAGTAGNSIRVVFEDDTEDVTVSTNDITVKFPDGTSAARVAALINADVEANLLVKASGSSADTLREAMNSSLTALAGGAAAVAPSKIVQDLTFSSDTASTAHNGATVTYTTGATAGSEVVSVSGSDVSVQIENGVSTATQIAAALNASAAFTGAKASGTITYGAPSNGDTLVANGTTFTKAAAGSGTEFSTIEELTALIAAVTGLDATDNGTVITVVAASPGTAGNALTLAKTGSALTLSGATLTGGTDIFAVTVSGTGATAQKTVNALATSGAVGENFSYAYYKDQSGTALTASFVQTQFARALKLLTIKNDETSGSKQVIVSLDGSTTHIVLNFGETFNLDNPPFTAIYLKYGSAAPNYRVMAVGV